MAKKKKKHFIKLNNKIRNYFKGLPFDEGVTTLDEDKLVELVMLLEIPMVKLEREEMIRALRRVWSEEGYKSREQIVSFLTQPYRAVPKGDNVPTHIDKVEKILQLLDGVEHTKEEENRILDAFIDLRLSKITQDKVVAKLGYLRLKGRLHSLEKALDVHFNSLNEMTFYESFTFCLKEHDFTKKLLCTSDPVPMEAMWEKSDEEIIKILDEIKEKVYQEKKTSLDIFLAHLKEYHHPYLTEEQMTKALKSLAPEESLYHAPIAFDTVKEILNNISEKYHIHESIDHIIIEKEKHYELFGTTLYYMTSVSYEKTLLYNFIWRGEELPVKDELNDVNDRLLAHFKLAVEEVYEEMRQMCGTLKVEEEVIEGFIVRYIEAQILSSRTLKFKEKSKRRILFHFGEYLKPLLARQKREELLAKTIRDFKRLFPLARELKRKIIFHVGPTNSGKTYSALQALKEATTGYYLAPLRLLALEGYESLNAQGVH
ncbi:MAG: helicase-related protein, partial [Sulfurovum sp.]